jgi:hypothetical protein
VEIGADVVTQVVDIKVSAVYKALILNKPDIVIYYITINAPSPDTADFMECDLTFQITHVSDLIPDHSRI